MTGREKRTTMQMMTAVSSIRDFVSKFTETSFTLDGPLIFELTEGARCVCMRVKELISILLDSWNFILYKRSPGAFRIQRFSDLTSNEVDSCQSYIIRLLFCDQQCDLSHFR
jgi:hypothetical protein